MPNTGKKYNQKTYLYLEDILNDLKIDEIKTKQTIKKKYNLRALIKSYIDAIDLEWDIGNYIRPTNHLHMMFELCKKYIITTNIWKRRSRLYQDENELLKKEISFLKEKYNTEITNDLNSYNFD
tara:strand:- start:511 stop:882 length:372 start_codon:yes stop_codon:yes gene_type:complete